MQASLCRLRSDHLSNRGGGIVSICSSRREVLEAAMEAAAGNNTGLLVEATANQVNQFGGYTGMTPSEFTAYIGDVAAGMGFPQDRIVLGADHLGPYVWRSRPAEEAMIHARELVRQCIAAGFQKIHLDTAFSCADDPQPRPPTDIAAERALWLCREAEAAASLLPSNLRRPLYVIDAEVPAPGGALIDSKPLEATPVDVAAEVLNIYAARFRFHAMESAWQRVLALVVQPGVDFGDDYVAEYQPRKAAALSAFHAKLPGIMTYEVHAADYQPPHCLSRMVADHFTLLKIGPCLTYAFREAVFALERIERDLLATTRGTKPSNLRETLERTMIANPVHWRDSDEEGRHLRLDSYRDRVRYYWGHPEVASALDRLMHNLPDAIPAEMIRRYFPEEGHEAASAASGAHPAALIRRRIQKTLRPYLDACRPSSPASS